MFKRVIDLAGRIPPSFHIAMAQAAYLRRHGYLQDRVVAGVSELAPSATEELPTADHAGGQARPGTCVKSLRLKPDASFSH